MSKEPYRELTEQEKMAPEEPNVELPPWASRWKKNLFGYWFPIDKRSDGVPWLDPSFETYWSM